MGVLEDAIREHLELKRAHGASDEEVEREESEALGSARRAAPDDAEGAASEELEDIEEPTELADGDFEPAEPADLPAEEDLPSDARFYPEDELPPESEPEAPADFAGDFDAPPEPESVFFDEEEPGVAPPMPEPAEPEPEPGSDPEAAGGDDEDVLEDTPDFLQDTPDHDRLWFEQKPPRDFDFD